MINCIIIDDEAYSIETLTDYIDKTAGFNLIGAFTNPIQGVNEIAKGLNPDLIYLDIDMPKLTGFELAGLLPEGLPIIYITAFSEYALPAFETNVYDFLLKPVSYQKFLRSAMKIKERIKPIAHKQLAKPDYFFINPGTKGKMIKLSFSEIVYVEGLKNYIIIHSGLKKHTTYLTMAEIESALLDGPFLRIHKSYIVNLNKIQSIDGNMVAVKDAVSLPVGANYKASLMQVINEHAIISKRKDN
ncbi:LytTR family two component transcriptional regulator [Mucilaginibacter oryzae]|uniref:LytTR family two component transcriptional regulator n=1 Tax=Mucilaginibacter oryzae TaxID=468058 RepID=A0A316H4T3_9SPHI|nr:LytTR family transcriptional regulator DNA-binding domain-containing protein [Mucilaginibacter oryzae]PWK70836.1 LytTR family two component transcriptional regulator [Mucilaginibacter oryzae]